jgi:hypothetical protein
MVATVLHCIVFFWKFLGSSLQIIFCFFTEIVCRSVHVLVFVVMLSRVNSVSTADSVNTSH